MNIDRTVTIIVIFAVLAASGCGGGPSATRASAVAAEESQLEARMNAIAVSLGVLGYEPIDWTRSGDLEPGGSLTTELDSADDGRMVLIVIGDATGANLDLGVAGPGGSIEAADDATDHRAAVELATSRGTTYTVTISNASVDRPSGYLSRAFCASPETEPAPLFGLFDDDPRDAATWDDVEARTAASGMSRGTLARTVRAGRGERLDERIEVEAGRCYLFVAQGSAGIDSLAVRLSQRDALLVADLAGRTTAWVRHCAESRDEVKLSIEVLAGSGRIRIASFSAEREELDPALVGPPLHPREPLITLEAAIRWTDQQLARAGYDPAEIQFEDELEPGERQNRAVRLEATECVVFSAISGPGIHDLDLEVQNPGGDLIAGDSTAGPNALVRFCASTSGDYEVSIVGRGGAGSAVMMVSRLPRVELPTSRKNVPRGAYEAAAVFRRVALEPLSEIVPVERVDGEDVPVWSARVMLERDRCYGVGAAARGGAIERLELIDPAGETVALWKRDGLPAALTACAAQSGSHEVRVELLGDGAGAEPLLFLFGSPIA